MPHASPERTDAHVHVGVLRDDPAFERYGGISARMRRQAAYRIGGGVLLPEQPPPGRRIRLTGRTSVL